MSRDFLQARIDDAGWVDFSDCYQPAPANDGCGTVVVDEAGMAREITTLRAQLAEAQAEIAELKRERDQFRSAIFGRSDYCEMLRHGNFIEMIRATEAGRRGAIVRAEAAETENAELEPQLAGEREACAKVAERWLESSWQDEVFAARSIADAIRARSTGPDKGGG